VDVIILSIPFARYPELSGVFSGVPADVVVIDTSNYYPFRDGEISRVNEGQPEAVWVGEQLGRPVIKAWNAVLAATLSDRGRPAGTPGRIAIPVAGDDGQAKAITLQLVDATGFDGLDAGMIAESWRQQPGTPAYCTELTRGELEAGLAAADRKRAPQNRGAIMKSFMIGGAPLTLDEMVSRNRDMTR